MIKSVAIVDFGLGNLFSVQQACAAVDLEARVTCEAEDLRRADAIILPGVGAFADAMSTLREARLDAAICEAAVSGKLVVGICLGMQLLCTSSDEFGHTKGLGIIDGTVRRLPDGMTGTHGLAAKVPEVGWNMVRRATDWSGTPLEGLDDETQFYFVHSFVVEPADQRVVLSTTMYGSISYCSSVAQGNTFGFQFHPERSGLAGLRVYENLRRALERSRHGDEER